MNEETKMKRKDWIKNVAIVFLSIMLVLTFFSNTIMNYSLPEVATAMIEPGSITAKIRGTGTLTSDDPYKVSIQESRVIASVAVKAGDIVEKDQVLFYLEDKESAELEAAQKELDELILSYTTAILNGEISNQSFQNIQSGNISSTGAYQARIEAAKQKVDAAQALVDNLAQQIAITGTTTSTQIGKEADLAKAETELRLALENKQNAENKLETAQAKLATYLEEKETALQEEKVAKTKFESAVNSVNILLKEFNEAYSEDLKLEQYTNQGKGAYDEIIKWLETQINNIYSEPESTSSSEPAKTDNSNSNDSDSSGDEEDTTVNEEDNTDPDKVSVIADNNIQPNQADNNTTPTYDENKKNALIAQLDTVKEQFQTYFEKKTNRESVETILKETNQTLSAEVSRLTQEKQKADAHYEEWKTKYNTLNNEITNTETTTAQQNADLTVYKINAEAALAQAKAEQEQLLTDISTELDLGNQNSIIREKRQEIAELKEKAVGAVVTAPVAGVITEVYKTAGESTMPEEELAVMQPEGKGYSLSFSVTPEQAKKVKVGEIADIQNSWYYDEITATIVSIRPDPENPGQKKLLVFNVEGDVQAGQTLSLSVGQKSANYDLLVPNSAVREDNNGKFILIVESQNSPLGNRYIATRVDVEVLGSDDVKTAISAMLNGYEYVITTATQPVKAGQQVRLAES